MTVTWPGWPSGSDRGPRLVCSRSVLPLPSSEDSMWRRCRNTSSAAQVRLNFRRQTPREPFILIRCLSVVFGGLFQKGLEWQHFCSTSYALIKSLMQKKTPRPCSEIASLLSHCVFVSAYSPGSHLTACLPPGNPTALLWPLSCVSSFHELVAVPGKCHDTY